MAPIRPSDTTVAGGSPAEPTAAGTTQTVPVRRGGLYNVPDRAADSTLTRPDRGPMRTVTARVDRQGPWRTLQQVAKDEGVSVEDLLDANPALKKAYEAKLQNSLLQQLARAQGVSVKQLLDSSPSLKSADEAKLLSMLDKYRSAEHQLHRQASGSLTKTQIFNDRTWFPADEPIYVPKASSSGSVQRTSDDRLIDEVRLRPAQRASTGRGDVVSLAAADAALEAGSDEEQGLRERLSAGHDDLPLGAAWAASLFNHRGGMTLVGNDGLPIAATVASLRASMRGSELDLTQMSEQSVSAGAIKPNMLVTFRDKSDVAVAASEIVEERGRRGVRVYRVNPAQDRNEKLIESRFVPLSELHTAGTPKLARAEA